MDLPTYIKEKEEAFDKTFVTQNPWKSDNDDTAFAGVGNVKEFLTQAIKDSYALGIERAIEVAQRRLENTLYVEDIEKTIESLQKELSSIRGV